MKVCGKCGAQCMDNQIYCHSCGAALDEKKGAASKATDAVKDFGQDYKAYTDNNPTGVWFIRPVALFSEF